MERTQASPTPKVMLEPHPGNFWLNESRPVSRQELKLGALTIWMAFSVIPGRIQMERFIPVENFRKKGNTFRGISFFPLLPEFPRISVPFVHSYSSRLFTVILTRKNAKDLKDGGRFPKRLWLQCVYLLVGSVGGRFRTQLQPCRWKRITFCGRYLCFSFTCIFFSLTRYSAIHLKFFSTIQQHI